MLKVRLQAQLLILVIRLMKQVILTYRMLNQLTAILSRYFFCCINYPDDFSFYYHHTYLFGYPIKMVISFINTVAAAIINYCDIKIVH